MPRGVRGSGPSAPQRAPQPRRGAGAAAARPPLPQSLDAIGDPDKPLGSVHIDSLSGDALKRYARRAGVRELDVQNLTEDRLRQNTKLAIQNLFDLITED